MPVFCSPGCDDIDKDAAAGAAEGEEDPRLDAKRSTVWRLSAQADLAFSRLNSLLSAPPLTQGGEEEEEEERKTVDDAVDLIAAALSDYWQLKKDMAAGTEPPHIERLLASLTPFSSATSLCGAGGGGFGVVMVKRELVPWTVEEGGEGGEEEGLTAMLQRLAGEGMTAHSVSVDAVGLHSRVLEAEECSLSSEEVLLRALSRTHPAQP